MDIVNKGSCTNIQPALQSQLSTFPVFIVICAEDCCQECADTYIGKVLILDRVKNILPPLHKNCVCSEVYFASKIAAK